MRCYFFSKGTLLIDENFNLKNYIAPRYLLEYTNIQGHGQRGMIFFDCGEIVGLERRNLVGGIGGGKL